MAEKIVDVFVSDELLSSYPVALDVLRTGTFNADLIEQARVAMRKSGYAEDFIAAAKFVVRDIPE